MGLIQPEVTTVQVLAATGTEQTTTASFVNIGPVIYRAGMGVTLIRVRNTHATLTANVQVLGSLDNVTFDIPVVASAVPAAVTTVMLTITSAVPYIEVQIQDASGHATLNAQYVQRAI